MLDEYGPESAQNLLASKEGEKAIARLQGNQVFQMVSLPCQELLGLALHGNMSCSMDSATVIYRSVQQCSIS